MSYLEDLVELSKRLSPAPWRLVEHEGVDTGCDNYFVIEDAKGTRLVEDGSGGGRDFPVAFSEELEDIVTLRNSLPDFLEELRSAKYNMRLFKEWYEAAIEASYKNLRRAHQAEKTNSLLADKLELVCSHLSKDGDCPLFWYCPAKKQGKSCGELTDKDWIEDAEGIVKWSTLTNS